MPDPKDPSNPPEDDIDALLSAMETPSVGAPGSTKAAAANLSELETAVRSWCHAHAIYSGPFPGACGEILLKHFEQWMARTGRPMPEVNRKNWGQTLNRMGLFPHKVRVNVNSRRAWVRTMSREAAHYFRKYAEANPLPPEGGELRIRRKPKSPPSPSPEESP